MANYANIFDNTFERRVSDLLTIMLKTGGDTVYKNAVLSSSGVQSITSDNLDKEFRCRKSFSTGVGGHGEPDYDQIGLYGADQTKAGPFQRFRENDSGWPDPMLAPGQRNQTLEYGMFSWRGSMPIFHSDKIADSDPTLVSEVFAKEMESVAVGIHNLMANSFYTSGNQDFRYAGPLTTSHVAVQDLDASGETDWSGEFSTNPKASLMTIDISTLNEYALNRLEHGMPVDLIASSSTNVLNEIGSTGVRALGRVVNIDWISGKVAVAFFATAAATGPVSSTSYVKNQLVDIRDFASNVVANGIYAGSLTPAGTWVDANLTPAYVIRLTNNSRSKSQPLGINDWWKTDGELLAGTGYQNGSVGSGKIDVSMVSALKSYHEDLGGAAVTPALFDRVVHRLMPQYSRIRMGMTPDTAFTTYGVLQSYIQNVRATAQLMRGDGSLDLSKEGATTSIKYATTSGVELKLTADPMADAGRIYIGKMQGNWKIDVPPEIAGGSNSGPASTPTGLPVKFVAQRAGHSTPVVPLYGTSGSTSTFTADSYAPMEMKFQLSTEVPIGAIISNVKETTGYGSSTNFDA